MLPSRAREVDDDDDEDVNEAADVDTTDERVLVTRVRGGDFLPNRLFKTDCPQILLLLGRRRS